MNRTRIDFVLPWVDGSDPRWQAEKMKYETGLPDGDSADARALRYRDNHLLRYWFRGVERFAPWVGKIFFVTCGQRPEWLNTAHPKLVAVEHKDYIPEQWLPTFSANPIELNLHRIEELSEQFVYFNDDTFLLRPAKEEDFFYDGLPCDAAAMNPVDTLQLRRGTDTRLNYFAFNDIQYVNLRFDKRACVRESPFKFYNLRYGSLLLRNILLAAWPRFTGFVDFHLPQPYLKGEFEKAWEEEKGILESTCAHRFRDDHDVNQWLIRYRQLAEGHFHPVARRTGCSFCLGNGDTGLLETVRQQKRPMICINDGVSGDTETAEARLREAFDTILPQKSAF